MKKLIANQKNVPNYPASKELTVTKHLKLNPCSRRQIMKCLSSRYTFTNSTDFFQNQFYQQTKLTNVERDMQIRKHAPEENWITLSYNVNTIFKHLEDPFDNSRGHRLEFILTQTVQTLRRVCGSGDE